MAMAIKAARNWPRAAATASTTIATSCSAWSPPPVPSPVRAARPPPRPPQKRLQALTHHPMCAQIAVKRAYRRLAAEFHPDKCPGGDIEKCREVFPKYANAYEILSSSEMRKNYDYVLANP